MLKERDAWISICVWLVLCGLLWIWYTHDIDWKAVYECESQITHEPVRPPYQGDPNDFLDIPIFFPINVGL